MSKEIKFRGKSESYPNVGKWVYGTYSYAVNYPDNIFSHTVGMYGETIDPETICEFIGKKDDNKIDIYEQDIVRAWGGEHHDGFWELDIIGQISYQGCAFVVISNDVCYDFGFSPIDNIEVIGNIHDNPELLP